MTNLQQSLSVLLERNNYPELTKQLLLLIINHPDGGFDVIVRNEMLAKHNIRRITDIKNYTLDVITDYALLCMQDGVLTDEEIKSISLLKLFLGIEEGDFYRNGKKDVVKLILTKQLQLLFADGVIDSKEAIFMSDMQGLFGLSYVEYEEFILEVSKK